MKNVIEIDGYKALIVFDPNTNRHLGEFMDFNGGAEF
jgi:predicted HicB family RNase H-like nuclease